MYTIDKSIPIPETATGTRAKYPLDLLRPGESFFVKLDTLKKSKNLRSSMSIRARKLNIKIVTLADETGVRVWRTA